MLPHLSLLLSSGGSRVGEAVGKLPPTSRCLPASFPASPVTFAAVLWSRWVRVLPGVGARPEQGGDRVGTQQGGRQLCKRNMPPVTRNPLATRSLLHLASITHSSRDDKEVTPCHPGPNRPDHRRHWR